MKTNESFPERLVGWLNNQFREQTAAYDNGMGIQPFEYLSSGNQWAINLLQMGVADSEEHGGFSDQDLADQVLAQTAEILDRIQSVTLPETIDAKTV